MPGNIRQMEESKYQLFTALPLNLTVNVMVPQESESSPKLFSLELQVSDLQFGLITFYLINIFLFISDNRGNIHTGGGEYNTFREEAPVSNIGLDSRAGASLELFFFNLG